MFKEKTLIVVGAGASSEVGLPTGANLKNAIGGFLDFQLSDFGKLEEGDSLIFNALKFTVREPYGTTANLNSYLDASRRIKEAMSLSTSIDDFIETQRDDPLIAHCGKLAITRSILDAERRSKLYFVNRRASSSLGYDVVENTWFNKFHKILTESCNKDDLAERFSSLAMVIFNYDRCVEHFIFNSIQTHYPIDSSEAADLVRLIKIYHPYGKVGHLPWEERDGASIDFGGESNFKKLLSLSKEIRTFTEGTDPESSEIDDIKNHVKSSRVLLFLGFAFHRLNMKLLQPEYAKDSLDRFGVSFKCFATARGESVSNRKVIEDRICKLLQINSRSREHLYVDNLTCVKLFEEYGRSLTFD
jgi:hypothetical protein